MIVMPLDKVLVDIVANLLQKPLMDRALLFPLEIRARGKQTANYFAFIVYRPGIGRMIVGGKFLENPIPTDRDTLKWNLYLEKSHVDRKCFSDVMEMIERRLAPNEEIQAQFVRPPYWIPVRSVYLTQNAIHLEELPIIFDRG